MLKNESFLYYFMAKVDLSLSAFPLAERRSFYHYKCGGSNVSGKMESMTNVICV
jgi:hypothetical protein